MKTEDLWNWLQRNHDRLAESLLEGSYKPQPVRLVEIRQDSDQLWIGQRCRQRATHLAQSVRGLAEFEQLVDVCEHVERLERGSRAAAASGCQLA